MEKRDSKKNSIFLLWTLVFFLLAALLVEFLCLCKEEKNNSYKHIVFYAGTQEITDTEYNFYKTMLINGFCTLYDGNLEKMNLDISKDLSEQECIFSSYETWEDYFDAITKDTIQDHTALIADANKNGYINQEGSGWNDFYKQAADKANEQHLSVANMFRKMYGDKATEANIKTYFEKYTLANNYTSYLKDNFEISEEEIQKELDDNSSLYETISYLQYDIYADIPDGASDEQVKKAMANTKTKAKEFFDSIHSEETFESNAKTFSDGEASKIRFENVSYQNVDAAVRDKLFECEDYGQILFIEDNTNNCYKIVYFIEKILNEYDTATIRQILITPISSTGSYLPTEEDYSKAEKEANEIKEEFLKTKQTEEDFAKLAEEKSSDVGSAKFGGLIDMVEKGTYETEMDEWIFDSREPGDVGIVKTTYGYHILYFVEYTEPAWKINIAANLKQNKVNTYIDEIASEYNISDNSTISENKLN